MIKFQLLRDMPDMVQRSVPTNANFIGFADITDCTPEQYAFVRRMGGLATGGNPLMETECGGDMLGEDKERRFLLVAGI